VALTTLGAATLVSAAAVMVTGVLATAATGPAGMIAAVALGILIGSAGMYFVHQGLEGLIPA